MLFADPAQRERLEGTLRSQLVRPASLPGPLRALRGQISGRPGAQNFFWLIADRGVRLLVALLVGTWSARYLGVANYGLLNYCAALVAIFAAAAPLGMDGLVVREIIRDGAASGCWLGTAIGFRCAAAVICATCCIAAGALLRPAEKLPFAIVLVLAIGVIGQSLESGELLFQARVQMRSLIVPRLGLLLAMSAIKVGLILGGLSVFYFALLTALEQSLSGLMTLVLARRALNRGTRLHFEWRRGLGLLQESWPLLVAGFAVIVYIRVGQIMLGNFLGDAALGIYSAGTRVPEMATFLPMVLASSMLPGMVSSQAQGPEAYKLALLRYFRINVLLAYSVCLPLSLGAPWIIQVLFHKSYAQAAPIMAVYAWGLVSVFLGVARSQHLLNERMTRHSLVFSLIGLAMTLTLNLLLIPRLGVMGAAVATVVSYTCSGYLASFLFPATRPIARLQTLALISPWLALRRRAAPELRPFSCLGG